MDRMFAPWRLAFVEGRKQEELPSPTGCIFCDYPVRPGADVPDDANLGEHDEKRLVVTAREHAFVILNKYPYTNGHVMVVPHQHTDQVESLDEDAFIGLHSLLRETIAAVREAYRPHGMNVGMNMGKAGGAGIDAHVHYHVLPRWDGDNNFMPVLNDTRVIMEGLDDTYQRMKKLLRQPHEG